MLTIAWNANDFHAINVLSNGIAFNTDHYITDVLIPLAEGRKTQVERTDRKVIVHADSARPYTAEMTLDFLERNGMKRHLTHRTHLIWNRLISISSAVSSSS
jgi:transposase InsO family protein